MTGDHNGHISDYTTIVVIKNEGLSENNRSIMCEQSSGKLYGTGCIQRYAPGDREGTE